MMNYSQALEMQVRLARAFREAEESERLVSQLGERLAHGAGKAYLVGTLIPLEHGECFYWSPALCGLLEDIAARMPNWTCDPNATVVPIGFASFARPLQPEQGSMIVGIGWMPMQIAEDGKQFTPIRIREMMPWDALQVVFYVTDGTVVVPGAFFQIPRGESILTTATNKYGSSEPGPVFAKLRLFAASVSLLSQRILVAPSRQVERHARKRAEREGWTHEPLIRVIELRRRAKQPSQNGEHGPVEWSHQWIVSGFWRQQWYPSLGAHQPRWIMPYIKGDPSKPLKLPRAKIFAVVR